MVLLKFLSLFYFVYLNYFPYFLIEGILTVNWVTLQAWVLWIPSFCSSCLVACCVTVFLIQRHYLCCLYWHRSKTRVQTSLCQAARIPPASIMFQLRRGAGSLSQAAASSHKFYSPGHLCTSVEPGECMQEDIGTWSFGESNLFMWGVDLCLGIRTLSWHVCCPGLHPHHHKNTD